MWRLILITILLATSAHAALVTVEKRGLGDGTVTGSIMVGSGVSYGSGEFATGTELTFGFLSDRTNAELLGWGGICAHFENRPTCTFTINSDNDRRFSGVYPVILGLGYTMDGVCRAGLVGPLAYMYFRSLEEAFTAVKTEVAYNPVQCLSGNLLTVRNIDGNLELHGGFPSFTPNTYPIPGDSSTISSQITVTTGTMTIAGDGGITIACGYRIVDGPYIVTEAEIIGATPCDFGLIIR